MQTARRIATDSGLTLLHHPRMTATFSLRSSCEPSILGLLAQGSPESAEGLQLPSCTWHERGARRPIEPEGRTLLEPTSMSMQQAKGYQAKSLTRPNSQLQRPAQCFNCPQTSPGGGIASISNSSRVSSRGALHSFDLAHHLFQFLQR